MEPKLKKLDIEGMLKSGKCKFRLFSDAIKDVEPYMEYEPTEEEIQWKKEFNEEIKTLDKDKIYLEALEKLLGVLISDKEFYGNKDTERLAEGATQEFKKSINQVWDELNLHVYTTHRYKGGMDVLMTFPQLVEEYKRRNKERKENE